ncbi:Cytochrome P450 [Mycena indigotica]|uniref:Cytochrome P450 n=1 Tax=Mycena indigotica TaxID=2126181 RepID=A0A8H6WC77_9AGAR|nr:Cytochrome P450 [Mycena indigotica]KAF7312542.1 Cytochrome P450 [Mycena indigotica]
MFRRITPLSFAHRAVSDSSHHHHLPMSLDLPLPFLIGVVFVGYRVLRFLQQLSLHGYTKGYRPLLDPHSLPGNAIPATWWHMGFMWPWTQRKIAHFHHTRDLTTIIPILAGKSMYIAASVGTAKQIWGNEAKTHLIKPSDFTTEGVWGNSIASANGDDWKRHRRVVAPAISPKMISRVVEESSVVYEKMCQDLTSGGKFSTLINLHSLLLRVLDSLHPNALAILIDLNQYTFVMICRCGFGMSVEWKQSMAADEVAIFDRALSVASATLIHRLIFPTWVWRLPIQRLRDIDQSWKTVLTLMTSLATERQAQYSIMRELGEGEITDLFTKLVSSTDETSRYMLTPAEVVGVSTSSSTVVSNLLNLHLETLRSSATNKFIETTSSALMSTLVFLGLHPDTQQTAYDEIVREIPFPQGMTVRNIFALKYLLACMHEAHRLVPATINLPRDVPEDMVLHTQLPKRDVVIHRGSRIMVDIMAVCHNPHDFPAPETYNPSRWMSPDLDVKEDIIMFGAGPRACVGRRFAQVEALSFLVHFLHDWKVETVLQEGETHQMALDRVLTGASMHGTAFGLGEVPVKIVKRNESQATNLSLALKPNLLSPMSTYGATSALVRTPSSSSSPSTRTKILLLGQRRAGKSSIKEVLFNALPPKQTFHLETTMRVDRHPYDTIIPLEIWDCPGNVTVDTLGAPLSQFGALIFVIDIRDVFKQPINKLVEFIVAAQQQNPSIFVEVFVHKSEKFQEDDKIENFRQIQERVHESLIDRECDQMPYNFHLTSVYDHTLHEAFSKVLHKLIHPLPFLEDLVNVFCANSQSPKAFLFDIASRLYVATDNSPVDSATHNLCCDYLAMLNSFGPLYRTPTSRDKRLRLPEEPASTNGHSSLPPTPSSSSSSTSSLSSPTKSTSPSPEQARFYPSAAASLHPSTPGTTLTYHLVTPHLALVALVPTAVYEGRRGLLEYNVVFVREGVQEIWEVEREVRRGCAAVVEDWFVLIRVVT